MQTITTTAQYDKTRRALLIDGEIPIANKYTLILMPQKRRVNIEDVIKEQLILELVGEGKLSIRQGADIIGLDYFDFLNLLKKNRVMYADANTKDMVKDLAFLKQI